MMKKISIAFVSCGGVGNLIIHANFIKSFRDFFLHENFEIVVFGHPYKDINEAVFYKQNWVDKVYNYNAVERTLPYDACINLHYFPQVAGCKSVVMEEIPNMYDLLMFWKKEIKDNCLKDYLFINTNYNINASIEAIIKNKTCLNIADIGGKLGITNDYLFKMINRKNLISTLYKFGLEKRKFITLQRGVNPFSGVKETPRLWPLEYYNQLVKLLKKVFPDVLLVQLGENKDRCSEIKGIDINLVGKTDIEDLKVLLQFSWLHIDGECGMVHMRKALGGGPSVVMFGQTIKKFLGYEGNINISTDSCPVPCSRLTDDWQWRCARGDNKPRCMYSITPEIVIKEIIHYAETGNTDVYIETPLDKMVSDKRFVLDSEWVNRWLKTQKVLHYDIETVKLSDILATVYLEPQGFSDVPLNLSPIYCQLSNQDNSYQDYINLLIRDGIFNEHTPQSFDACIQNLNMNGYNQKNIIILDGRKNTILDGMHRASWLLYKYGNDYAVNVVKLWFVGNLEPLRERNDKINAPLVVEKLIAKEEQISSLLKSGEINKAKKLFTNTLEEFQNWPRAKLILAHIFLLQGEGKKAANLIHKLWESDPNSSEYGELLLSSYFSINDFEKISNVIDYALAHNVHSSWIYKWISTLQEHNGNIQRAIENATKALDLSPNDRDIIMKLAHLFRCAGNFQASKRLLLAVKERFKNESWVYVHLSLAYELLGDLDNAIDNAHNAYQLEPNNKELAMKFENLKIKHARI